MPTMVMASLGAITIVGMLERNDIPGFNMRWWEMVMAVVVVGISVSGWVLYRFRQTRALTMAQFFEMRYSRSFRVFAGGQIAVMITDFVQGIFVNAVFIVIVIVLMLKVDWAQIFQALAQAPADASLVDPFRTGSTTDYNFWSFFIGMIGVIYGQLSLQGHQA